MACEGLHLWREKGWLYMKQACLMQTVKVFILCIDRVGKQQAQLLYICLMRACAMTDASCSLVVSKHLEGPPDSGSTEQPGAVIHHHMCVICNAQGICCSCKGLL